MLAFVPATRANPSECTEDIDDIHSFVQTSKLEDLLVLARIRQDNAFISEHNEEIRDRMTKDLGLSGTVSKRFTAGVVETATHDGGWDFAPDVATKPTTHVAPQGANTHATQSNASAIVGAGFRARISRAWRSTVDLVASAVGLTSVHQGETTTDSPLKTSAAVLPERQVLAERSSRVAWNEDREDAASTASTSREQNADVNLIQQHVPARSTQYTISHVALVCLAVVFVLYYLRVTHLEPLTGNGYVVSLAEKHQRRAAVFADSSPPRFEQPPPSAWMCSVTDAGDAVSSCLPSFVSGRFTCSWEDDT